MMRDLFAYWPQLRYFNLCVALLRCVVVDLPTNGKSRLMAKMSICLLRSPWGGC